MKSTTNNAMKRIEILPLVLMVLVLTITSATLTLGESLPQKLLYLSVEKPYYELGEKMTLIITAEPLTDYELSVLSSENLYKYSGEIKNNIDFYPKEEGLHRVELVNKLTKAVVDSLEFYAGKPVAGDNNGEIINGTNETSGVNETSNETQLTNQTNQTNQGNQSNATEIINPGLTRLILTDKQVYAIGETVIATVSIPLDEQQNYKLYYEYEGFDQRYMGDFTYITLVPQGLGTH
jgi:hypothetical protein